MFRMLPWILALMTSLDLTFQIKQINQSFMAALALRRELRQKPWETRREFCQKSSLSSRSDLHLLWKEGENWSDTCQSELDRAESAPRYWKVDVRPKYRLLFLGELPITMSIVILS